MNFPMIFKSNANLLNIIRKFTINFSKMRPRELKENENKEKNQKQPKIYLKKNFLTEENQCLYGKFKQDLQELCGNIAEGTA